MRPIPVPDDWLWKDGRRVVLAAPDGDLLNEYVRPVEAVVDQDDTGKRYSILMELDDGDLAKLATNNRFWLTVWGSVPVFAVQVVGEDIDGETP